MTRLEDHYRLHPFTFFITHMVGMVAFLVVVISLVWSWRCTPMSERLPAGRTASRAPCCSSALSQKSWRLS